MALGLNIFQRLILVLCGIWMLFSGESLAMIGGAVCLVIATSSRSKRDLKPALESQGDGPPEEPEGELHSAD